MQTHCILTSSAPCCCCLQCQDTKNPQQCFNEPSLSHTAQCASPFLPQNLQQRVSQSQLRTFLTAVYQLVVLHTTQLVWAFPAGTFISNFQQPPSK